MKILWINPIGTDLFDAPIGEFIGKAKAPETEIDVVSLRRGPMHLEYHYYEALVLADTLHEVRRAEVEGYDAAVIGCFYDPGLMEARETTDRLVVTAPAESAMHIATTLGYTFSVIVGRKKWIPKMHENVVKYGFSTRLASFKSVELGVYDFQRDKQETARRLRQAAKEAVEVDRAEVIVLGCTIEFGFYRELQRELGVPVIDAVIAPLKYAEFLVELRDRFGWSHSKVYGYQSPPPDEIRAWRLAEQYGVQRLWE
ncbi:TPA: hydantoin racemase [Candidatus Bipolaricaulota bacterium]|nr:hydantoin racemase [Candidatus Bipolaricaulota bacterium]